jgi:uncharacterized protein YdeI (YjbR/CyaY-like superfamily)
LIELTNGPVVQIKSFKSASEFRVWLSKNHASSPGIWLRIYKKDSGKSTVTYSEALDHSLCYGWIDGQRDVHDEASFVQKFTPRRPKSGWSKLNTERAERLIKSGEMAPAGLIAIEAAKADGRWKAAYDSPARAKPPADFLEELNKDKKARAFFATLEKRNTYAILYRLQTAKTPETRDKRMKLILDMLAKGEKFHP